MVDPISLEVFRNLYGGVAEEMGEALRRASFSPNIRERLDLSCAVFDSQGRMVAQAAHIPVHLGSMPASVAHAMAHFERVNEGDIIVLNDPYGGGTHLPDLTMISPVYDGDGVAFYLASRAHHADIGGMAPGSLPLSTDLYQEGLILPPSLLQLSGWLNEGLLAVIMANSRAPQERQGDLEAQMAAHRVGERRLRELIARYGHDSTQAHAQALIDYAQRLTEATIRAIPDGVYRFTDFLEGDGQRDEDIPVSVELRIEGAQLVADFSASAPQVRGNVNAVLPIVQSALAYVVRLLAEDDIPMNAGCFAPLQVIAPQGSLLNPRFPAAVAAGNTETSQRIVDVLLGALAQALPERIPAASQGTMNNLTIGARDGGFVYYETLAGGHGGGPQGPGLSGRQSHMTNTQNTPIEALELSYPLRVWRYDLRSGSGGAGQFSGGEGLAREYEFLSEALVTLNSERRRHGPYGLRGGNPGSTGRAWLIRQGRRRALRSRFSLRVQAGDRLLIETPGGGGWGAPSSQNNNTEVSEGRAVSVLG